MNTEEAFLLVLIILISVIVIWLWVSVALWISKRLKIPVAAVILISFFTGGLGFFFLLIMALAKEDNELAREERAELERRRALSEIKKKSKST